MSRRARWAAALALSLAAAACDSGPKGPGTLDASVVSDQPLGALVLEFAGGTVTGFQGQGDTQVYAAELGGTEKRFRVILVSPSGGQMRFGIQVSDQDAARPSVSSITAATTANAPVVPSAIQIRIEG